MTYRGLLAEGCGALRFSAVAATSSLLLTSPVPGRPIKFSSTSARRHHTCAQELSNTYPALPVVYPAQHAHRAHVIFPRPLKPCNAYGRSVITPLPHLRLSRAPPASDSSSIPKCLLGRRRPCDASLRNHERLWLIDPTSRPWY